jgi:hypothetical protein
VPEGARVERVRGVGIGRNGGGGHVLANWRCLAGRFEERPVIVDGRPRLPAVPRLLVKLHVREAGTDAIKTQLDSASMIVPPSSRPIAYRVLSHGSAWLWALPTALPIASAHTAEIRPLFAATPAIAADLWSCFIARRTLLVACFSRSVLAPWRGKWSAWPMRPVRAAGTCSPPQSGPAKACVMAAHTFPRADRRGLESTCRFSRPFPPFGWVFLTRIPPLGVIFSRAFPPA